jgi:long-chain acyl-CoA synthetase
VRMTRTLEPLDGLGQLLPRLAQRWADRPALVTDDRSMTFGDLHQATNRLMKSLRDLGVAPGVRVAICAQNRWEWVVSYHAVLGVGAVVVPVNVMSTGDEVAYLCGDAGVNVLLASGERLSALGSALPVTTSLTLVSFDCECAYSCERFVDLLAAQDDTELVPSPVDPDSLACVAYTSGTTGRPKGAMQSHRSLVLNCAYTATMHARNADDVVVTALPAAHFYGNVVINATLMAGGRVELMTRFSPVDALHRIQDRRATLFEGVPAMYAMLMASPSIEDFDLSSLTRSTVGGQTIATFLIEQWELLSGAPLIELWGMTELSGLGTTHCLHAPCPHGSVGIALPGVQVKVVKVNDVASECQLGEPGELIVRGPIVTMGYFGNPEATAEALTDDGWLHTGDVATQDGCGRLFIVDRLKDMIVSGGYNVYPAEIERVLMRHEAVALAAVGHEPDCVKGEVAHAYVVLATGRTSDPDSIVAHCRRFLAAYKVPRAVHFVDALPMTSSGKVMRRMLGSMTDTGMA